MLRVPLGRLRGTVNAMAAGVEATVLDSDFDDEIDHLYATEVQPALDEIAGAVASNSYLARLETA